MPDNQLNNSRILIVDDRESNLSLLEGLLKKQGYSNYKSLSDSRQVLPTVQEWKPDLILLDLMMPHMDGFAVMQALKPLIAQDDYLPILVLTADATAEAKRRALSGGAVDFLTKPFDATEVILRVGNLLQTRFLHRQLQNQNVLLEEKVVQRTAQLIQMHDKLQSILDSAGEGIYGVDLEGRTTFANPATLHMLGFNLEEMLGKLLHALIHHSRPDGTPYPREECPVYAAFMNAQIYRVEDEVFWRKDGSSFFVEYTSTPLWDGDELIGAVVAFNDITERKQAEKEINYHARLLRYINDAVIATDNQIRITAWNRAAEAIYGWTGAEVMGRDVNEILGTGLADRHAAEARELLKEKSSYRSERINSRKDGQPVYVEENTIALFDEHGRISGYVSVHRDITDRKRAEEFLQESEEHYRNLFTQILHGFALHEILCDETGRPINYRFLEINPAFEALTGLRASEVVGRTVLDVLPDTERYWIETYGRVALTGESIQFQNYSQELGKHYDVMAYCPKPGQFAVLFTDVTERKQAEEKIEHQLQHLKALHAIDVAISSNFNIHVTLDVVLQQVLAQLGVDAAAIVLLNTEMQTIEYTASQGFRSNVLHHTQLPLSKDYAGRAMHEHKTIHIQDLSEADGKFLEARQLAQEGFVDYHGTPLTVKGEIIGVLETYHRSPLHSNTNWLDFLETLARQAAIAIENATLFEDLQRANAELEQRVAERTADLNQTNLELENANRTKDEFLASMSHELRTPLNSILGLSESLLEKIRGPLNEKQEQALQIIASSGKHLLGLINDILDVSKVEAGKMDIYPNVVNVREICQSSLNFIKEAALKKSITVDFQLDPSISTLFADLQRLKQILVNLLSNAVKFTPEGGKVTFDVTTNPERDQIGFSISDNGIGIAPDDLKKLFRPFMQVNSSLARQNQGTGLGLTIVYKLTELHGGSVQVESEVGKGSRFIVILPWNQAIMTKEKISASPAKMEKPAEVEKEPGPGSAIRAKILVAEDNEANLMMLSDFLQDQGFEVIRANNGIEALARAEETLPDLILMDIQMPEMHGLEAIQRLRANPGFASTPIIALTALAMPGDRERCLDAGANEYMSKPAGLKKLLSTMNNLLGGGNK